MYYVNMTDKALSGWGKASGLINKLCIACETYQEAETVEENALNRSEMIYVNICTNKPQSKNNQYYSWKDKASYPNWFNKGAF